MDCFNVRLVFVCACLLLNVLNTGALEATFCTRIGTSLEFVHNTGVDLSTILGDQNIGGEGVAIANEIIGVSQSLGARTRLTTSSFSKVYAYGT